MMVMTMMILVVPGERPHREGGQPLQQPAGGGFGCQEPQQDLLHEELQQLAEECPDWWVSRSPDQSQQQALADRRTM